MMGRAFVLAAGIFPQIKLVLIWSLRCCTKEVTDFLKGSISISKEQMEKMFRIEGFIGGGEELLGQEYATCCQEFGGEGKW